MNSFCTTCQQNFTDALYCPNCGGKLLAPPTAAPAPAATPQVAIAPEAGGFVATQKTPMATGKLIGFIGGGLVVALVIIFGAINGINNARIESLKDSKLSDAASSCVLSGGLTVLDSLDANLVGKRRLNMTVKNDYGSDLTATDVACVLDALNRPSELTTKLLATIASGSGVDDFYSWDDIDSTFSYSYYQGLSVTLEINDSREGY